MFYVFPLSCFRQILKHTPCLCLQAYLCMEYMTHPNTHKWKEKNISYELHIFSFSQFRNFLLQFIIYRLKHIAFLEDRGYNHLLYKLSLQYRLDIRNNLFVFICREPLVLTGNLLEAQTLRSAYRQTELKTLERVLSSFGFIESFRVLLEHTQI